MSPNDTPESTSQETSSAPVTQSESSAAAPAPTTVNANGNESARAASNPSSSSEGASSSGESSADDGGDDEAGGGGEGAEAGPAGEGEKKKRRRRRRKKKAPGEHGADAAGAAEGGASSSTEGGEANGVSGEHAGAEGADGKEGARAGGAEGRNKKKRNNKNKRREGAPLRERPAFNVSDVVFGKITEVNDDVIYVDLSGKGTAIFDKLELVLPEDSIDVEDEARRSEELAESILAGTIDPEVAVLHAAASTEGAAEGSEPSGEATDASASAEGGEGARGKIIRIVRPQSAQAAQSGPSGEEDAAAAAEAEAGESAAAVTDAAGGETAASADAAAAQPAAESAASEAVDAQPAEQADAAPAAEVQATDNALTDDQKSSVLQLPRVVLEPGAPFVGVVRNDGSRGGLVVLTHHPHRGSKSKPLVVAAFKKRSEIFGLVTGVIKGGVEVDIDGVRAFAPGSQMELRLGADLHPLIGKRLPFLVTHYAKRGRDVIVSRRSMLEAEAKVAREAALAKLKVGETVDGVVRSIVQFGAFIDLGGVEGLVPLTEMSHNRGDRPSDVFKVNETVSVLVQRIDDRGKIWLSRRATQPDPWGEAAKKYALGTKHTGKIVRIQPFGAFVELERGIDGLIHTADLSFKRIEKPEDVVKVGDELEVLVSSLDNGQHKIGLHPALTGAMAEEEPQKVEVGRTVKAQVVAIETGGLMMRILGTTGRSARAFMPASTTGTPRGTELRKLFPPGHVLDAKVIEKDPRRGEVKLSIKAMQQDTERNAYQAYRQQVKREAKFGTFADLLAKKK